MYWFIELCVLIKFIYAHTVFSLRFFINAPNGKKLKVGGVRLKQELFRSSSKVYKKY